MLQPHKPTAGDCSPELLRASPDRWIRFPEVAHITGLSKTSIYRYMAERGFPRPKKHLGLRLSLWRLSEVVKWMERLESQSDQKDA